MAVMLGLGLGLSFASCYADWSPGLLFGRDDQGIFSGGFAPQTGRLFQDLAGSVPALLPGQTIALCRDRVAGFSLSQSASASRPTLGRHPRSGRRNLAHGASAFAHTGYWPDTRLSNALTSTKIGQGVENGRPYIDIRWTGTAGATSHSGAYQASLSRLPAALGESYTAAITARLIAGSLVSGQGIAVQVGAELAPESWLDGRSSSPASLTSDTRVSVTHTITAASTNQARIGMVFLTPAGAAVDATFRLKDLQFERGSSATPPQLSYGPLDLTDPSEPDLWYLHFDGNDDHLNCAGLTWPRAALTLGAVVAKTGAEGSSRALLKFGTSSQGFQLNAPASSAAYQISAAAGSAQTVDAASSAYVSPHHACLIGLSDAQTPQLQLRVNKTSMSTNNANQGALSGYGSASLILGGASNGFAGRLYDLFLIDRPLTASEITLLERYFSQLAPGALP